ncbi:hypothetical protein ABEF79_05955 [Acinetobacter sp. ANC 7454]|uniref:hypothetical protein n=1 Tax=Acinetobacter thermotolerans TaxID=3151487 RepID=UPI00325A6C0F
MNNERQKTDAISDAVEMALKGDSVQELLRKFEKTKTFKYFYSTLLRFDAYLNCYVATESWRNKEAELLTAAWWMLQEAQLEIDNLIDLMKGEAEFKQCPHKPLACEVNQ